MLDTVITMQLCARLSEAPGLLVCALAKRQCSVGVLSVALSAEVCIASSSHERNMVHLLAKTALS